MVASRDVIALAESKSPSDVDGFEPETFVPRDSLCFAPVDQADSGALMRRFEETLATFRRHKDHNPFGNPVQLLALEIHRELDAGALSLSALEQLIQRLTAESFVRRAARIGAYLGSGDRTTNETAIKELITGLSRDPKSGRKISFEAFRRLVERARFGIVITAHPTFSLSRELQESLVELSLGVDRDGAPIEPARRRATIERISRCEHRPDTPLDLAAGERRSDFRIESMAEQRDERRQQQADRL